mmetsp:Transcript_56485/g.159280  ORF Transcript_56485/g.159280 Transcript_56485/m.159280 type:complete len:201 (+) Transcript_56485:721-1323(+)
MSSRAAPAIWLATSSRDRRMNQLWLWNFRSFGTARRTDAALAPLLPCTSNQLWSSACRAEGRAPGSTTSSDVMRPLAASLCVPHAPSGSNLNRPLRTFLRICVSVSPQKGSEPLSIKKAQTPSDQTSHFSLYLSSARARISGATYWMVHTFVVISSSGSKRRAVRKSISLVHREDSSEASRPRRKFSVFRSRWQIIFWCR